MISLYNVHSTAPCSGDLLCIASGQGSTAFEPLIFLLGFKSLFIFLLDFSMSRWIGSQVPELENGWEQAYKPIHPSKGLLKAFRLVPGSTHSAFNF